jgi:hypothetical protein
MYQCHVFGHRFFSHTFSKIIRGPSGTDGSETNAGTLHSSAVKRDESAAGVDLTRCVGDMWYGTISIGTPPKSFTGKVFQYIRDTHSL